MQTFSLTDADIARFWAKVEKSAGCWEWTSQRRNHYGLFSLNSKPVSAHRVSYFLEYGEYDGLVLHKCDNPPCVRPDHLFIGTHQDNTDDMFEKGRRDRRKPREKKVREGHKISHADYLEIVEALKKPYWGQVNDLAEKYGVQHSMISHIKTGRFVPAQLPPVSSD